MSTVVVAKFRNKREANEAIRYLKALKSEMKLWKGESWDDFYFGKMIEEGMKEKTEVPVEKIHKLLRK